MRGFLSRATNHRTDEYGGSLENRARLLHEIVAAVREAIGRDLALGVRLCGDELIEHGITIDETVEVAQAVEDQGLVDYINTSIGVATASLFMIEASMHIPPEYALFIPSALRKAVDLPVVGVGRFKDPLQAERALAQGHADLVGVVRGQIADADFAAKARAGSHHDIRLCLSCNQECVGRMGLNRWLGCIENPLTGREAVLAAAPAGRPCPAIDRAPSRSWSSAPDPAGLQAAIAAARARPPGHRARARRRSRRPGPLAARVPNRAEFGDLVRNQVHECDRLGVEMRTGTEATVELIDGLRPDAVVVATGSTPGPSVVGSAAAPRGCRARSGDAAGHRRHRRGDRPARPSGHVIVIDEVGFHQATSVAELLADRGLPGRGAHPRHGRRPGPRHHPRHGGLVDPGGEQGHRAGDRLGDRRARGRRPAGAAPPDRRHHAQDRRLDRAGRARRAGRRALLRPARPLRRARRRSA